MTEPISESQLRRILLRACRAPSGGNGQPWSFVWDGATLEVFFDEARSPRVMDPELRGSWMQVGIFLECLSIAASTEQLAVESDLQMPHREGKPYATVRFVPTSAPVSPLAATLADRYTDRRPYAGGTITAPVFEKIRADAAGAPAGVYFAALESDDLIEYILDCDMLFHTWPVLHRDTWTYQRWSLAKATKARDGVYYQASGLNFPMSRVIKGIGDRPGLIAFLEKRGYLRRLLGRRTRVNLASAAGMGLVTVRGADPAGLVPAGRVAIRAWLMAQLAGYSSHALGPHALIVYYNALGCLNPDVPAGMHEVIARGEAILKREFRYPDDEYPVALWRVGVCPGPLPERMRTLRRNLDDVLRLKGPRPREATT